MVLFFACGFVEGEWGALYATRWSAAQKRKLAVVTVASVAALFVNPYGWRLVAYPLDALVHDKVGMKYIAEWASLDFHSMLGKTMLATLLAMAFCSWCGDGGGCCRILCWRRWACLGR